MIPITINDQQFEVSPDLSVLEAAREQGIHIPTLCYHEALESVGACRLCIMEGRNFHNFGRVNQLSILSQTDLKISSTSEQNENKSKIKKIFETGNIRNFKSGKRS